MNMLMLFDQQNHFTDIVIVYIETVYSLILSGMIKACAFNPAPTSIAVRLKLVERSPLAVDKLQIEHALIIIKARII